MSNKEEYECPSCKEDSTFSPKGGGAGSGNLTCDSCSDMPRAKFRREIRSQQTEAGLDE